MYNLYEMNILYQIIILHSDPIFKKIFPIFKDSPYNMVQKEQKKKLF